MVPFHIFPRFQAHSDYIKDKDQGQISTWSSNIFWCSKVHWKFLKAHNGSILNVFNKLRVNTVWPILSLIWFFTFFCLLFVWSALHFPIFLVNFDQKPMQFDLCYPCSKDSIKTNFISNIYKIETRDKTS